MRCVFTLSTARSGTRFLCGLAKSNLASAVCRHEPFFDWGNPTMFGPSIAAHTRGDHAYLRRQLDRKRRYVESLRAEVYVETSHAFLKSYYDLATEYFDDIKVFHLVRDPLRCALSEATRRRILDRVRVPGRRYRDPEGRSCLRWSLTGYEPIFRSCDRLQLTPFQFHLVEWIELQNRAVEYLDRFDMHDHAVTLDSPRELNDPGVITAVFRRLGLACREPEVRITGKSNRTPFFPTRVTTRERDEAAEVLEALPAETLEIFRRPFFARFAWTSSLLARYQESDSDRDSSLAGMPTA
jgi:hypothetical protein